MANGTAKIITPQQLKTLRNPLPRSWIRAAGIWKNKRTDPIKWQRKTRQEWEDRVNKLHRLMDKAKKNK